VFHRQMEVTLRCVVVLLAVGLAAAVDSRTIENRSLQVNSAATSLPNSSTWAWIFTGPLFDKWESITGKATVTVRGTTFTATMFDAEHPTLALFTLTGTISTSQVRVRAVREHSDVSPANLSGKLVTRSFGGFADVSAVQTILLYDDSQHQIGLTRTLRR
jgi:hypothetical protein